jgi:transposase
MAGRPTSLTPELHARIVKMVRDGNFRTTALKACGLSKNVIRNWEKAGEEGREPYAAFMADLQQAEAESETELLSEVRNARPQVVGVSGPDLWQARLAVLERRFPNRWSARVRTTVDEELSALMKRLEAKLDQDTFAKVVNASREDAADEAADPRH